MYLVFTPKLIATLDPYIKSARESVKSNQLYEQRLNGIVAGHEFSVKVCKIMQLKAKDGVATSISGNKVTYLKSTKAEAAYEELLAFLYSYDGQSVFDVQSGRPPYYLEGDILRNDAFSYADEKYMMGDRF
jgi:hypothetical protein